MWPCCTVNCGKFSRPWATRWINTSPEPVTNWVVSVAEDVAVIGGLWAVYLAGYNLSVAVAVGSRIVDRVGLVGGARAAADAEVAAADDQREIGVQLGRLDVAVLDDLGRQDLDDPDHRASRR